MQKIMFNDKYGLTTAVLEGRKTMTRRLAPEKAAAALDAISPKMSFAQMKRITDLVIENYASFKENDVVGIAQPYCDVGITPDTLIRSKGKWTPSKETGGWSNKMFVMADHMKHFIRIKRIRVERLWAITNKDCIRDGIRKLESAGNPTHFTFDGWMFNNKVFRCADTPREAFSALFNKLSGKGAWDRNPWVFVYEFELLR